VQLKIFKRNIMENENINGNESPIIVEENNILGKLTDQDYEYILNINKQQKEISMKLGTLEIDKAFLMQEFMNIFEKQRLFEEQLYSKYKLVPNTPFKIDTDKNIVLINE